MITPVNPNGSIKIYNGLLDSHLRYAEERMQKILDKRAEKFAKKLQKTKVRRVGKTECAHRKLWYNCSMSNYKRFYNDNYKYVFFTLVTYNRKPLLIDNINILRSAFRYVILKYHFEIFAICILKDHLHLILKLENTKDYSEIIRLIKYILTLINIIKLHLAIGHFQHLKNSSE